MRVGLACAACVAALLAACAATPPAPAGLMDVAARPAESALLAGIRAYEDAQYPAAETQLRRALAAGLTSPRDRATAHKYLAFIACSGERPADCESEFREARKAEPSFALTRSEAGHPVWGPVYRRITP